MDNKNFCLMRQICQLRFNNPKPRVKLSSQSRTAAAGLAPCPESQMAGEVKAWEGSAHRPSFTLGYVSFLVIGEKKRKKKKKSLGILTKVSIKRL